MYFLHTFRFNPRLARVFFVSQSLCTTVQQTVQCAWSARLAETSYVLLNLIRTCDNSHSVDVPDTRFRMCKQVSLNGLPPAVPDSHTARLITLLQKNMAWWAWNTKIDTCVSVRVRSFSHHVVVRGFHETTKKVIRSTHLMIYRTY